MFASLCKIADSRLYKAIEVAGPVIGAVSGVTYFGYRTHDDTFLAFHEKAVIGVGAAAAGAVAGYPPVTVAWGSAYVFAKLGNMIGTARDR